eukprot:1778020-Rhodomonas_salina.2
MAVALSIMAVTLRLKKAAELRRLGLAHTDGIRVCRRCPTRICAPNATNPQRFLAWSEISLS